MIINISIHSLTTDNSISYISFRYHLPINAQRCFDARITFRKHRIDTQMKSCVNRVCCCLFISLYSCCDVS